MLFNSFSFLIFYFIVLIIYFIIPFRSRWILLLGASYYFYMSWKAELIVIIVFSTLFNYIMAIIIDNRKEKKVKIQVLRFCLFINFSILFIFKYLGFFNDTLTVLFKGFGLNYPIENMDIILPMGISFYTFQAVGYVIDVYRGKLKAETHFGIFALFISFFPQLVAGPIERSYNLLPQFYKKHKFSIGRAISGSKIALFGFFKKIVIADRVAVVVNTVFNNATNFSGLYIIVAAVLFSFQLYCDFSGYSDIAIGTAKILGYDLMKNFDRPYLSRNIKEFWRRWHISLSSWFMDYLYIPLGGSKAGRVRHLINLMITFIVSGLWHGAGFTFIAWGFINGLYMVLDSITNDVRGRVKRIVHFDKNPVLILFSIIFTFGLATFSLIFFRANSISDSIYMVNHLLWDFRKWADYQYLYLLLTGLGLNIFELKIVAIAIVVLMLTEIFSSKDTIHEFLDKRPYIIRLAFYVFIASFILTAGVYYNGGEFIYFQF